MVGPQPVPDGGGTVSSSDTVLTTAHNTFSDLSQQFTNTKPAVGTHHDSTIAGAGQLSDHLQLGAAKFLLAWRETFDACAETTGIIAGNIGGFSVDLTQVDSDSTVTVTI